MVEREAKDPDDLEAGFERDAHAAGIVLPRRHLTDPWGALAVVVALIVIAAGVGEVTGWINLRVEPSGGGGFQTQTCSGSPVLLSGALSSELDASLLAWLDAAGGQLSDAVGGCVHLNLTDSGSAGFSPLLSDPAIVFAAQYLAPGAPSSGEPPSSLAFVPIALSAVGIVYDLPGIGGALNLSGPVLSGIFSGSITSWSDPAIAALNPTLDLSGTPPIEVFHDGGATAANDVLTEFLAGSSPSWNGSVGAGLSVAWPIGTPEPTDAAMATAVSQSPGAIGYLDLVGPSPAGLGVAQIEDAAGGFVGPNAVSTWAAAESFASATAVLTGAWSNLSLVGASAVGSYPISLLTYAGLFRDLGTAYSGAVSLSTATWLLTYVYWLTGDATLSPLPLAYSSAALNELNNETYYGTTIVHLDNENGEGGESGGETGEF
ncbi:MAG TPA: substrate-binding domain-containing protein [Thermoplasmata archaeon]|nr:substrate-binding domain-containing protein [Thermoplasmata archaeon]